MCRVNSPRFVLFTQRVTRPATAWGQIQPTPDGEQGQTEVVHEEETLVARLSATCQTPSRAALRTGPGKERASEL